MPEIETYYKVLEKMFEGDMLLILKTEIQNLK